MTILIKGMEMPKNCDDCFLGDYYCEKCEHEDGYHMAGGRPYHCPLVEVVRCKDCEFNDDGYRCPFREAGWGYAPDRYCSFGERKEAEQ